MAIQQAMHKSAQAPGQPANVQPAVVNNGGETALGDDAKPIDTTLVMTQNEERKAAISNTANN